MVRDARLWRSPHHDAVILEERALARVSKDAPHTPPRSRDMVLPEVCQYRLLPRNRGRREDRVRAAPAVSCALMHKKMRTRAYRFSGNTPAFPAQWIYGLYVLSLVNRSLLPPSPPGGVSLQGLDASIPGVRTTRLSPYANASFVRASKRCATQSRPPQPAPTSVTWPTPLLRDRMAALRR